MIFKEKIALQERLLADYQVAFDKNGVSGERMASRFAQIAAIGYTASGGSNRPGFSKEEQEAKNLVKKWLSEAGLSVYQDGAGNVIGRFAGIEDHLPAILSGSHVDTVPNGGHFDGVLGVLAALEVVEAWKATGYKPRKPFEVVVFTDEEGARFNGGLHGSEAMTGDYVLEEKINQRDGAGASFESVLQQLGLSVDSYQEAKRDVEDIELFTEVHIEQGRQLEQANLPCGIVTGIAGPCWLEVVFTGRADHAGNTPMRERKDALVAASAFIQEVNQLPTQISKTAVATVGKQVIEPNGVNVIAEKVTVYVDIRDIYIETRDLLVDCVKHAAKNIAMLHDVTVDTKEKTRITPIGMDEEHQRVLEEAFREEQLEAFFLPSGAGHDAMIMGKMVPVSMLFVQSKAGISHHPEEYSSLNDCVQAVHLLKRFLEKQQEINTRK